MAVTDLEGAYNLGKTIRARLAEAGIQSVAELRSVGPARAYRRLCERANRRLPVCYYLHSLEGALQGIHWNALPPHEKARLQQEAGLGKRRISP
ncbi:MAG: TfoX/Sxy family protein [Acidobacteria bacterium]|nr:TfoX/Sxy family protein [Acidobacteriota bacterium]